MISYAILCLKKETEEKRRQCYAMPCYITMSKYVAFSARAMLELGRSKSWTRALEQVSGEVRMDAKPLLDYFSTLHTWLKEQNKLNNNNPGWPTTADPSEF